MLKVIENQGVEHMDTTMAIDFEDPSNLEEVDATPVSYESENLFAYGRFEVKFTYGRFDLPGTVLVVRPS